VVIVLVKVIRYFI